MRRLLTFISKRNFARFQSKNNSANHKPEIPAEIEISDNFEDLAKNKYLKLIAALNSISYYSEKIHPDLKNLISKLNIKVDPNDAKIFENNPIKAAKLLEKSDKIYALNSGKLFMENSDPVEKPNEIPNSTLIRDIKMTPPSKLKISILDLPKKEANILLLGVDRYNPEHCSFIYGILLVKLT